MYTAARFAPDALSPVADVPVVVRSSKSPLPPLPLAVLYTATASAAVRSAARSFQRFSRCSRVPAFPIARRARRNVVFSRPARRLSLPSIFARRANVPPRPVPILTSTFRCEL